MALLLGSTLWRYYIWNNIYKLWAFLQNFIELLSYPFLLPLTTEFNRPHLKCNLSISHFNNLPFYQFTL
jgi:hypothetical protein